MLQSAATSAQPLDGVRRALLVTCSTYKDPGLHRLRSPTQDAEALRRVLADSAIGGFEVEVVADQPHWVVTRQIAGFFNDRRPEDLVLLYLSGHGVKDDEGHLYFAASDTELDSLEATAVAAGFVNRQMGRTRSRRIVLLLDCCYSGAFAQGMGGAAKADKAVHLRDQFGGRGRVVLTASKATEYSFEGGQVTEDTGQPSVFTAAIVRGLETGEADRNGDGLISLDELYDYVYDQVRGGGASQTPAKWAFGVEGELLVAHSTRQPSVEPLPLPEDLTRLLREPYPASRLGAVAELEALLQGDQLGVALTAWQALDQLRERDDSLRVRAAADAVLDRAGQIPGAEGSALPTEGGDVATAAANGGPTSEGARTEGAVDGQVSAPILTARLNVLEESLRRAQDFPTWKERLDLRNVEVADVVWNSAIMDIRKQAMMQLQEVDWIRRVLEGRPATNDPRSGFDAWARYIGVYTKSQQVFRACMELMGGLALRDKLLDERIYQFADEMIANCAEAMLRYGWLTVPAQQEALSRTLARVIHLRFPEWTIWSLPLTAYEYGHVALDEMPDLSEFVHEEARRLLELPPGTRLDDDDPLLPRLARAEHQLRVLMNDAFATYVVGPAYACAAILLRLDPVVASAQEHIHPADARRANVVLGMLDRMDAESDASPYGPVIARLRGDWEQTVAAAGPAASAPSKATEDLSVALDMVLGMLERTEEEEQDGVVPASTLAADVRARWERIVAQAIPAAAELDGPEQNVTIDVEVVLNRLNQVFGGLPGVRYPYEGEEGWEVAVRWAEGWLDQLRAGVPLTPPDDARGDSKLRDALNAAWLCRLQVSPDKVPEVADIAYQLCDQVVERRQRAASTARRRQAIKRPQQAAQRPSSPSKARHGA
jgi:hypothetical protein